MKIAVLGAGAWGTAIAVLLARHGREVVLVPRRAEHATRLAAERENGDYLPGFPFPAALMVSTDLRAALDGAELILLACPSQGMRGWAERLGTLGREDLVLISLAKGLELGTHLLPTQILDEVLPGGVHGTLSGPSNAEEVAHGLPTAAVLAVRRQDEPALRRLQAGLSCPTLRIYLGDDLPGVELAAVLKNIYAIAAGCVDGIGYGYNAKAAMMTRALAEMVRLGLALGARPETFYGLGGFGDLVATCTGPWSRNRTFGEQIGRGAAVEALTAGRRTVVEGYRSTRSCYELCRERGLEAPILAEVFAILYEGKRPAEAVGALMARDLKRE